MPTVDTRLFGPISYAPEQVMEVCGTLPGLSQVRGLLPLTQIVMEPFLFFQAIEDPNVSLLGVPARVVKDDFQLWLSEEDRDALQLGGSEEQPGADVGAFALVTVNERQEPTANLLAPLAIHFQKNLVIQAIQQLDESYLRFPISASVAGRRKC